MKTSSRISVSVLVLYAAFVLTTFIIGKIWFVDVGTNVLATVLATITTVIISLLGICKLWDLPEYNAISAIVIFSLVFTGAFASIIILIDEIVLVCNLMVILIGFSFLALRRIYNGME